MAFNYKKYQEGYRHKLYKESVELYVDMKIHVDGEYPKKLIEERRPHEPLHIQDYRKKIFQHTSMPVINKPIESIGRIRKSHDWDVKFEDANQPARIRKGENLKDYFNTGFPFWKSATNWAFSVLHKELAKDGNAICLVMPSEKSWEFQPGQFIRPYPYIFNSDMVLDFVPEEYVVVKSSDSSTYKIGSNTFTDGDVFYYADRNVIQRWEQSENGSMALAGEFVHNNNHLHAWKIGGVVKKSKDGDFLLLSRLYPMLPSLNEMVREYSDLQSGVVQHLFLERWEKVSQQCGSCKGIGHVVKDGEKIKCPNEACRSGLIMNSPYETIQVGKDKVGNFPEPPYAGYVEKDPKIIEIQDARIDAHGYKALAAVNMEFLSQTPLNQSGAAKDVDRDEANNFVYGWGEDIVRNLDNVAYSTCEQRYSVIVPSKEERIKMLPSIPVPQKFNILTANVLMEGIQKMRESKINPVLITEAEKLFAGKEFNADEKVRSKLELILSLDPLAGRTEDDKMMMLSNKGITPLSYIISSNIIAFVERASDENQNFSMLPVKKQKEIILSYAKEVEGSMSSLEKVMPDDNDNNDDDITE